MDRSESSIEALYATGHWLLSSGRHADAGKVFQLMTVTAPEDERGWLGLGAAHEGVGQLRIAAELYRLAPLAGAPNVRCAIARGRALRALGQPEAADAILEAATEAAASAGDDAMAALAAAERRTT